MSRSGDRGKEAASACCRFDRLRRDNLGWRDAGFFPLFQRANDIERIGAFPCPAVAYARLHIQLNRSTLPLLASRFEHLFEIEHAVGGVT